MRLAFKIVDRLTRRLADYRKALPRVAHHSIEQVSERYAAWVRERYLSGQVLGVRTGATRRSVQAVMLRQGAIAVRPGAGIRGGLAYLARFESGERPFMEPALRTFEASGTARKLVRGVLGEDLRRRGW